MTSNIEQQLKDIVVRIVHCEPMVLVPGVTWKDMKADSLDLVQILVAVEDTFSIEIPDEDTKKFQNFGEFVKYIETRVAEKGKA